MLNHGGYQVQNPRILLIDDDPISLKILQEYCNNLGYQSDCSKSGNEAWELLISDPAKYQIVIVDRMMEGVDGLELLKRIKAHQDLQHIPVIMQTGEAEPEEHIAAVQAGVFDFIYKPVEEILLMYIIRNALSKDSLERQSDLFAG